MQNMSNISPLFFSSKDQKSKISESDSSINSRACLGHLVLFNIFCLKIEGIFQYGWIGKFFNKEELWGLVVWQKKSWARGKENWNSGSFSQCVQRMEFLTEKTDWRLPGFSVKILQCHIQTIMFKHNVNWIFLISYPSICVLLFMNLLGSVFASPQLHPMLMKHSSSQNWERDQHHPRFS